MIPIATKTKTAIRAGSPRSDGHPFTPPPVPAATVPSAIGHELAGKRVAVALSGGVDSAVAALLLKRMGAHPVGLSLRLHDPDPGNPLQPRACCAPEDLQDARRVAEALDFPFYVLDAREAFDSAVVRPFVREYLDGRTPNPCVGCNSFVKLGGLARRARALGCEALATGHYARLGRDALGKPHLFAAVDREKDQSYFLFGTPPTILSQLVFPVGELTKSDVRTLAIDSGLPVAHKLDSQEVCFVGGAGAGAYVQSRSEASGDRSGPIVDEGCNVLGHHRGIEGFTVGQRKGLGLRARGPEGRAPRGLYVLSIDAESKTVVVGARESLLRTRLVATRAAWPSGTPTEPFRAKARIRYRSPGALALVHALPDDSVEVSFEEPVLAVAPGQAVVFYAGDEVLGGAWIKEAWA